MVLNLAKGAKKEAIIRILYKINNKLPNLKIKMTKKKPISNLIKLNPEIYIKLNKILGKLKKKPAQNSNFIFFYSLFLIKSKY